MAITQYKLCATILIVKKKKTNIVNKYWYIWLAIIVGLVGFSIYQTSKYCYRVEMIDDAASTVQYTCPRENYSPPLLTILFGWFAAMIWLMKMFDIVHGIRHKTKWALDALLTIIATAVAALSLYIGQPWLAYLATVVVCMEELALDSHQPSTPASIPPAQTAPPKPKRLIIDYINSRKGYTANMVIAIVAATASTTTDKPTKLVASYAKKHDIAPAPIRSLRLISSSGVFASLERRRLVIGSYDFLAGSKITSLPASKANQQSILVAVNGEYIGGIYFKMT